VLSAEQKLFIDAFNKKLLAEPDPFDLDVNLIQQFILYGDMVIKENYDNRKPVFDISNNLKRKCAYIVTNCKDDEWLIHDAVDLIWQLRLFEAKNRQLDSYLLYLEKNREPSEKFYQPKRKHFWKIGLIQALQQALDGELDLLAISLPPGTGKTTLSKFFISGVIGWFTNDYNLFFSHSSDITRMYYDGVLDIVTDKIEYTWDDIFPGLRISQQNAKMQRFNVGKYKPFPSLQCTTKGSSNAGVVRCSKFLLVDDIISGIEEALNKAQLEKTWDIYRVDARQRKIDGCAEIHIATRWSTLDPIGRLQMLYEGTDKRCKFIAVPDIDPETGKSNFDYDYNGFSVEFFHDQELAMDDISYRCLYKNDPIEREGLLYADDELRRYFSLPDQEPDAIIGVCDTKSKGIDYMVLPVMYQYGDDFYMVDCICSDNSDFGIQKERLSDITVNQNMQQCEFESNAGGDRLAEDVAAMVKTKGGRCNITTKATETNKETRIIVNSDWVKKHVIFKDQSQYSRKSDYGVFMNFLTSYSVVGKNVHDDTCDALANFALFVTKSLYRRKTKIIVSPI
jgi:predicted phage terminase large subunit-like protein